MLRVLLWGSQMDMAGKLAPFMGQRRSDSGLHRVQDAVQAGGSTMTWPHIIASWLLASMAIFAYCIRSRPRPPRRHRPF